jgi:hypothetical protein
MYELQFFAPFTYRGVTLKDELDVNLDCNDIGSGLRA